MTPKEAFEMAGIKVIEDRFMPEGCFAFHYPDGRLAYYNGKEILLFPRPDYNKLIAGSLKEVGRPVE